MQEPVASGATPHIFVVNSDPAFLAIIRDLLQDERYSVTTTNPTPTTFAQIVAADPALLIIDLAVTQPSTWPLLDHLAADAATQLIPQILVSTLPTLLAEAAARYPGPSRKRLLAKPLKLDTLLDAAADLLSGT